MKKNGTTTKGTTRWRCTSPTCGAPTTKTRPDRQLSADFNTFIDCICGGASVAQVAASHNISRRSLERRFYTFWFIDIPHHIDSFRIYDQIFIDGTYTGAGCLLIAATRFLRLPSFSGHPICTDLVSVGEDVHCESTAQEVHAGVPA